MSDTKLGSVQWRFVATTAIGLIVALAGSACAGAGGGGGGSNSKTITLAAVDNPQMADLKGLVSEFQKAHSDITVKIVVPTSGRRLVMAGVLATEVMVGRIFTADSRGRRCLPSPARSARG